MKNHQRLFRFIFTLGWLGGCGLCSAAPGALDSSFGGTGTVTTGFGGGYAVSYAAAVQSDGKLIMAGISNGKNSHAFYSQNGGDFVLARFTTNNALDPTFGKGGVVVTRVSTNYPNAASSQINAVQVLPDGRIVVGGYSYQKTNYPDFTLARYTTNGVLDTTFGTNGTGIVYTDLGGAQINALSFEGGTNIVAAGAIVTNGTGLGFALASYDTNGVLVPWFGTGGITVTSGTGFSANGLFVQSSGAILVAGEGVGPGDFDNDFALFHYTTNGVLDTTFTGGGEVFTRIASSSSSFYNSTGSAIAQQASGVNGSPPPKFLVAGSYYDGTYSYQAVLRYTTNGTLDTSFNSVGYVTNPIISTPTTEVYGTGLNVEGFGISPRKITVTGYEAEGTNIYISIARYTSAGALDTTFGTGSSGKTIVTIPNVGFAVTASANAMTENSSDYVVVGNEGVYNGSSEFFALGFNSSSGLVDTTFGTNGILLADVSDAPGAYAAGVALQADGKIVAAGAAPLVYSYASNVTTQRFALARYNVDGSLDTNFGSGGKILASIGSNDVADAVAIQPDGKIVALASSYVGGQYEYGLMRFNSDGSADTSFGNNGAVSALIGQGGDQPRTLQLQPDGKILAGGAAQDASSEDHFCVARFTTNGTLDSTFGASGVVITAFGAPSVDQVYGVGVQSNGRIVASGYTEQAPGDVLVLDFAASRYTTNGGLDISFGSLGRTTNNAGGGTLDIGYGMAIQPDGKILLAGAAGIGFIPGPANPNGLSGSPVNSFVALTRFNTNGSVDTSFGSSGTVLTEVGAYSDFATAVALQSDGKIVVAGATLNGNYQFFAMRYNTDGSQDDSYGDSSVALADFDSGTNEVVYGLALDSLGRAVVAGDGGGVFGLARFQGDIVAGPPLKIILTATNTAVVSWPYPSSDWALQQNTDPVFGTWSAPPQTVNSDGTKNFIIVSPPVGNSFYRLYAP